MSAAADDEIDFEPTEESWEETIAEQLSDPETSEALSVIAERFPSLRGAPGVRPFNIRALVGWGLDVERQHKLARARYDADPRRDPERAPDVRANAAIMSAILLLCRLTCWRDKRPVLGESMLNESHQQFDVYSAISWWSDGDRAAFAEWARSGVLPLDRFQREDARRARTKTSSN